jgi:hypothetical protein
VAGAAAGISHARVARVKPDCADSAGRLINGHSGFSPTSADLFETHHSPFVTLERLQEGVAYLVSLDVRYVVLHPHDYAQPAHAVEVIKRMQSLSDVAERHDIDGHTIFVLAPRQ